MARYEVTFEDLEDTRFQYVVEVYAQSQEAAVQHAKRCAPEQHPSIRLGAVLAPVEELPGAPKTEEIDVCFVNREPAPRNFL